MRKKHSTISAAKESILKSIADAVSLNEYFLPIITQTQAIHLLVYLAGLIICRDNVAMTVIALFLGICRHDALQRMLSGINLTSGIMSRFFIAWISSHRKTPGWLILDDTVLVKIYSKLIECAGYAWSSSKKRSVMGIHIVAIYWSDGKIKIPVGFRIWFPREKTTNYRSKVDLAIDLLTRHHEFCKTCSYIAFDSWYCSKQMLRLCRTIGLHCCTRLKRSRMVVFKGRKIAVSALPGRRCEVWLPGYGTVLVYRDYSDKDSPYLMSTDTLLTVGEVKARYKSRWLIEESFRFMKENLGLEKCQCRKKTTVRNHVSLVFLAHFAMETLALRHNIRPCDCSMIILMDFFNLSKELPKLHERKDFLKSVVKK